MNVVIIMSDEHSSQALSCYGNEIVKTPNIDRLANEGLLFENCYTPSPLCVPARASAYTGRKVHELGTYDNATPYDGGIEGLMHTLFENDIQMTCFGKVDFNPQGDYKNTQMKHEIMRIAPDVCSLYRQTNDKRPMAKKRFEGLKIMEDKCYDEYVLDDTLEFLNNKDNDNKPFVLHVGFNRPHFPFEFRKETWDKYNKKVTDIPDNAKKPFLELNQTLRGLRSHFDAEDVDDETVRKMHVGYYCSIDELDGYIGKILETMDKNNLSKDTYIIYVSDHGEQLGHHGLWWKCCMYEESLHVPLIIKGPGIPSNKRAKQLVSIEGLYSLVCNMMNVEVNDEVDNSLSNIVFDKRIGPIKDYVFSEYHAHGMKNAAYMIRWKQYKYIHFINDDSMLFDLEADPKENTNIIKDKPKVLKECIKRLYKSVNPKRENEKALYFQRRMKNKYGYDDLSLDEALNKAVKDKQVFLPEYSKNLKK